MHVGNSQPFVNVPESVKDGVKIGEALYFPIAAPTVLARYNPV
jgi:hypothetical protein